MPTICGIFDISKPNFKERDIKEIIFKIVCEYITICLFLKIFAKGKDEKCRIIVNRFTKNESTSDRAIVLHDCHSTAQLRTSKECISNRR